jgi:hypothetical protein
VGGAGRRRGETGRGIPLLSIALETLILGPEKESELTYRFRVRCAHLLSAKKLESREFVAKRVAELYGIRSGIVHKGVRDVPADELGSARLYAQRALLEILHTRRIKKGTDLEKWFNDQLLK